MPILDFEQKCVWRFKGGYLPFKFNGDKFNNSFFPHTSKLWNSISKDIQCKDLYEFKVAMKKEIKPQKYKHFSKGNKLENT